MVTVGQDCFAGYPRHSPTQSCRFGIIIKACSLHDGGACFDAWAQRARLPLRPQTGLPQSTLRRLVLAHYLQASDLPLSAYCGHTQS